MQHQHVLPPFQPCTGNERRQAIQKGNLISRTVYNKRLSVKVVGIENEILRKFGENCVDEIVQV